MPTYEPSDLVPRADLRGECGSDKSVGLCEERGQTHYCWEENLPDY